MSYVQEENGPGPTLACQCRSRGWRAVPFAGWRAAQPGTKWESSWAQLSRMLEVTDCGTAAHVRQASIATGPTINNNTTNQPPGHPPTTRYLLSAPAPGQAGQAGMSGSTYVGFFPLFPRATPHQRPARGPPGDALKTAYNRFPSPKPKHLGPAVSLAQQGRSSESLSECFNRGHSNLHKTVR